MALLVVTELRKNWLISASADGTVRVWDSKTLKPLWSIFTPTDGFGDALSLAYFDNRVVFGFQSSAIMVSYGSNAPVSMALVGVAG